MANTDIGKKFEDRFRTDYKRCFPGTMIYRLPDQQSGYSGGGSSNPCDFFCYPGSLVLMIECKAHKGASINFSEIRQYDKMLDYKGLEKTHPGVVVWFYEKDTVIWVSIEEMEKMRADGEKSIGLRMIDSKKPYKKAYNIITIPSEKLRVFMETDYNYLVEVLNGERFK
jgi:Holliday junction resolvase